MKSSICLTRGMHFVYDNKRKTIFCHDAFRTEGYAIYDKNLENPSWQMLAFEHGGNMDSFLGLILEHDEISKKEAVALADGNDPDKMFQDCYDELQAMYAEADRRLKAGNYEIFAEKKKIEDELKSQISDLTAEIANLTSASRRRKK